MVPSFLSNSKRVLVPIFLFAVSISSVQAQDIVGTATLPTDLADANAPVTWVAKVKAYCEGPSAAADGTVYFADQSDAATPEKYWHRIWKVDPDGKFGIWVKGETGANGTEIDNDGNIITCGGNGILKITPAGLQSVLVDFSALKKTGQQGANDLSVASNGDIWFTNWSDRIFFWKNGTAATAVVVAQDKMETANGIEYIEEKNTLYVNESKGGGTGRTVKYAVAADNSIATKEVFLASVPEADGITFDEKGNVYAASWTQGKILVFSPAGTLIGNIHLPSIPADYGGGNIGGNTSNCVFRGVDRKTLYITGDGGLYKVQMKVAGRKRPASSVAIKRIRNTLKTQFVGTLPLSSNLLGQKQFGLTRRNSRQSTIWIQAQ